MKTQHLAFAALMVAACGMACAQAVPPAKNPFRPTPAAPQVAALPQQSTDVSGNPAGASASATVAPAVTITEEEIEASRVGSVNGVRVYRGSGTYIFEKEAERTLVRRVASRAAGAAPVPLDAGYASSGSTAATPASSVSPVPPRPANKVLPSSVGRMAPKN